MHFDWDPRKDRANRSKHGVSFRDARSVFFDPLARIHDDPEHSLDQRRAIITGHSTGGRFLLVAFTDRGSTIRIVSARVATRRERQKYEEAFD